MDKLHRYIDHKICDMSYKMLQLTNVRPRFLAVLILSTFLVHQVTCRCQYAICYIYGQILFRLKIFVSIFNIICISAVYPCYLSMLQNSHFF